MSLDPPYSTGIFETIVGVHFGEGLAVEFDVREQDNSHITLVDGIPNFSKAVLSFGFACRSNVGRRVQQLGTSYRHVATRV